MSTKTKNHLPTTILEQLFHNEETSDIQLVFSNERKCKCENCNCNEPITLPAHRVVLAQGSPVFQRMLYGDTKQIESSVIITDWASCIFNEFLQIFYLRNVQLTSGNIAYILQLLVDYEMKSSFNIVEEFMIKSTSIENCLTYMDLTLTYGLELHLLGKLRQFCRDNAVAVLKTPAFRYCSSYILQTVLELNDLNCDEDDVFFAAMDWAKEVCKDKCIEVNDTNQRMELAECFYLIRFPTMTVEMFSKCLAQYPKLLTTDELLDILEFLTTRKPLKVATSFSSLPRMVD